MTKPKLQDERIDKWKKQYIGRRPAITMKKVTKLPHPNDPLRSQIIDLEERIDVLEADADDASDCIMLLSSSVERLNREIKLIYEILKEGDIISRFKIPPDLDIDIEDNGD
jgi:hypothetical protein